MEALERIVQESVPGKQVTIAHVIARPGPDIHERIGVPVGSALGILTLSPCETAIIAADVCAKAGDVEIGFLDRFTGSVVVLGDVGAVETAIAEACRMLRDVMGFCVTPVTRS
ncbi:BMC domain-containing protein [Caniella muris]|uniref:BMC domain-containing protein n=1 Tax=Caniella muris TaxID=2941502 RepID=UPI00203D87C1|nr:BMC domain-containing protein [Caniella muris]